MKRTIRLTESDLHSAIRESVRRILRESTGLEDAFKEVDFTDPEDRESWNSISNYVGSTREKVDQIIDDIYNGNYNKEIEQRTIWQKLQEIIPDLDSFMFEKYRNQIQNAINDQMSVADKEYAFKYGQEDHYGDDGYYEDEYGDWRHSFTDRVESDLTYGDSYDWNTSDDPYDSHEMRRQGLRNMNVFTTNDPRKRAEVDKAWDEHDSLERAKRRPDLFKKNGQLRKDSALDRNLKPRSNKHGATQAADKTPLHRKGSLNRD